MILLNVPERFKDRFSKPGEVLWMNCKNLNAHYQMVKDAMQNTKKPRVFIFGEETAVVAVSRYVELNDESMLDKRFVFLHQNMHDSVFGIVGFPALLQLAKDLRNQ